MNSTARFSYSAVLFPFAQRRERFELVDKVELVAAAVGVADLVVDDPVPVALHAGKRLALRPASKARRWDQIDSDGVPLVVTM